MVKKLKRETEREKERIQTLISQSTFEAPEVKQIVLFLTRNLGYFLWMRWLNLIVVLSLFAHILFPLPAQEALSY